VPANSPRRILTMNRGSATLKSALYDTANQENLLLSIDVDEDGVSGVRLKITDGNGATLADSSPKGDAPDAALNAMFGWLEKNGFLTGLAAAGHRIVHGGSKYTDPQRISPEFVSEMETLLPLDPDHLPAAIHGIRYIAAKFPGLPQVACFDTAFHRELPTVARMYALPRSLYDRGIRRFGFHGLSYEYVMSELRASEPTLAGGRVIIAHLGSGASIAAVKQGKSVDTSMGFTPLEGLVMSTRSGDLDPGALIYLLETERRSAKGLDALLNKESGLLGVSGITGDMRSLLEKMPHDAHAAEAVDLFCYRVKKYIGAYAAALGGLDALVFAGGIGERAPAIREKICEGLDFLGIRLDAPSNQANATTISARESPVKVRMIKTNEDLMIVRHVLSALGWN
jgi:acetate kinase